MSRFHFRVLTAASISALIAFASGCLTPQSDAVTSLISSNASATVANSAGGDVYLSIDTAWESTPDTYVRHGTCQVNTGAAIRQTTCTIRIPEGQLYFSNLRLTYGTANPTSCKRVQFVPAVYQMSDDPAFVTPYDPSSAGIDCSATALIDFPGMPGLPALGSNLSCINGPARALYNDWPTTAFSYIVPVAGALNEASEEIPSGNGNISSFPTIIDGNYFTNVATVNKIDDPTSDVLSPTDGLEMYLGNSMRPYRARCLDSREQILAEVLVYIADEDLETGEDPNDANNDQFFDFGQTL